jgi:hypothetical protein
MMGNTIAQAMERGLLDAPLFAKFCSGDGTSFHRVAQVTGCNHGLSKLSGGLVAFGSRFDGVLPLLSQLVIAVVTQRARSMWCWVWHTTRLS